MNVKEALQGDEWLGHPLHPALVAGPIGMWILSLALDGAAAVSKNKCVQEAADFAMLGGLVGAGMAAATGIAEYTRVPTEKRVLNTALTHGSLNAAATSLFAINASVRNGRRKAGRPGGLIPKLLSLAGVAIVGYTGWLGGTLVYRHGVAVQTEGTEAEKQTQRQIPGQAVDQTEMEARAGI